jgi:nitroimidazol reductase NimA-like FMN-containing flavoprotein (pyridoxamine 5'-phosphate oxidase superfamily)
METPARPPAPRDLSPEECRALIARNYIAVVATVGAGEPYAIPLIYGFEDDQFFFVTGDGRKMRNINAQPRVCITIVETGEQGKNWRSVLAFGEVAWLSDDSAIDHALAVLRRQYPGQATRSSGGPAALARAGFKVACVTCREISGRAQVSPS